MTREEIVNSMSLQDAIQVFKDTNAYGTMDIAKSVILKALGKMPQWIPVSEGEYPEAYTEVLVYDNSDYFIAWWTGIRGRWDSYNSQFDINTPYSSVDAYRTVQGKPDRSRRE